jgi:hypothetical protein
MGHDRFVLPHDLLPKVCKILGSCSSSRHFRQTHLAIALFRDFLSDEAEEAGKLH